MKKQEFDQFCEEAWALGMKEMKLKGPDYTDSGDDRHSNFKDIAARIGLMPVQVWGVYFLKHIAAIERYIRDGELSSEPIDGRMKDALNYILLGWSLVKGGGAFEISEPIVPKHTDGSWDEEYIASWMRRGVPPTILDDEQTVGESGNEAPRQLYRERPLTDVTEDILKDQKAAMGEETEEKPPKSTIAKWFEGKPAKEIKKAEDSLK